MAHRGMKGHKARCQCIGCKALRKKGRKHGGGAKTKTKRSSGSKTHVRELRRALGEAKRGRKAASRNGDAASWARFNSAVTHLEGRIRARR